jgi:hypothetical protein
MSDQPNTTDAPAERSKRRRLSVSIRELALLILALGFAFAWWHERKELQAEQEKWSDAYVFARYEKKMIEDRTVIGSYSAMPIVIEGLEFKLVLDLSDPNRGKSNHP